MPYIKSDDREKYDKHIQKLVDELTNYGENTSPNPGHLNYIVSKLFVGIWRKNGASYTLAHNLLGTLPRVDAEFTRRYLNEYESQKIKENGDI